MGEESAERFDVCRNDYDYRRTGSVWEGSYELDSSRGLGG